MYRRAALDVLSDPCSDVLASAQRPATRHIHAEIIMTHRQREMHVLEQRCSSI
jgi:hypothetical protein